MMDAVHIKTSGFYCNACPIVIERALRGVEGVADVAVLRSANLTSVLYDETIVDRETLCARIREVGFGAEPADRPRCRGGEEHRRETASER